MSEDSLFSSEDLPDLHEKHWGGMPEFVQEDKTPHRTIMIHFRNTEDVKRFAAVIGIELFDRTQSTWYPEMPTANLKALKQHPDVASITWKWKRWQHHVDYRRFEANALRLKSGVVIPRGVNDYGMELQGVDDANLGY